MAEILNESKDYFVTTVDGVEFVVYVDDIGFLRGEDPEIRHEGGLEFTVRGIGNGQQPSYFMVTTVDGFFAEVKSTSSCGFDSCARGMDLNFDFSSNPKTVSSGQYTEVTESGEFYNEPVLLLWGDRSPEPRGWEEAINSPDYSVSVSNQLNQSYCGGDTAAAEIEISNQMVSGDISVQVQTTNLITGLTSSESVTVPQSGTTYTAEAVIPEDTNSSDVDIISIAVNGNDVYSGSASVGASSSEIHINSVDIPDSVKSGSSFEGSISVTNNSDCEANIAVSIAKK